MTINQTMNRPTIRPQEVLDSAGYLFNEIEDADIRDGIVRLATALLLPEALDTDRQEFAEALIHTAIEGSK